LHAKGFHGPDGILEETHDIMVDMLASLTPNDLKDLNKVKQAATEIVRKTIVKRAQLRPLIVPSIIEV
jgi:mRNA degradation ribonuclease J1/J2